MKNDDPKLTPQSADENPQENINEGEKFQQKKEPISEKQGEDMNVEEAKLNHEEDTNESQSEGDNFEKLMKEYEQQMKNLHRGSVVEGKIVKIGDADVLVDIGARCEGAFSIDEIKDESGNVKYKEGDAITVQVLSSTNTDYTLKVSHSRAKRIAVLDSLRKSYREKTPVVGRMIESVNGGMKVDLGGVEAFLPASQIELRYVEKTNKYIGKTENFRIMKFNPRMNKIIVSRRVILQEEQEKVRKEIWDKLEVGKTVKGRVTRITGYGVFVDLGGIEGLIHISNLSWDKVVKPSEIVKIGDEIEAQVLDLDKAKGRIGLGLKQLVEDPWLTVDEKYTVGTKVTGIVEKLESFGAFVKLEPGVTALIPISEMSWAQRIKHPSEILKTGEEVECIVLKVDPEERKISISLKQIMPSPFEQFIEKHNVGDVLEGEVTNVVAYGAFVRLADDVEGLVHISEASWAPTRNIEELYHKGDKITVKILGIKPEEERISLSTKVGEPPEELIRQEEGDHKNRDRRRKRPRKPQRKSRQSEEDKYIVTEGSTPKTKLGELFPEELLQKMKNKKKK